MWIVPLGQCYLTYLRQHDVAIVSPARRFAPGRSFHRSVHYRTTPSIARFSAHALKSCYQIVHVRPAVMPTPTIEQCAARVSACGSVHRYPSPLRRYPVRGSTAQ